MYTCMYVRISGRELKSCDVGKIEEYREIRMKIFKGYEIVAFEITIAFFCKVKQCI